MRLAGGLPKVSIDPKSPAGEVAERLKATVC